VNEERAWRDAKEKDGIRPGDERRIAQ